jgi:hypothetical protein
MDENLLILAISSQQLGLLRIKRETRTAAPTCPTPEHDSIALELPLVAQARRDLDREFSARAADNSMTMPDKTLLDELKEATQDLSNAIAGDQTMDALIGLGQKVLAMAQQVTQQ